MDSVIYWRLRKLILKVSFKIKASLYRMIELVSGSFEYNSFRRIMIISSLFGIIKIGVLIAIIYLLDSFFLKSKDIPPVDQNIFVPIIIGGISVAGIILGLYCANITSIFSSRYVNAPMNISKAFQSDKLTRKCISGIVDYIIFGFLILTAIMIGYKISWLLVSFFILGSISVIVAYSIAGNRAYQLSDVYGVAADSNRILYRIVSKG